MRPPRRLVRLVPVLPLVWILATFLVQGAAGSSTPSFGQFPPIAATSLDGTHISLPGNFQGQLNLVVISFAREQQKEVDSWIPAARKVEVAHPRFRFYELPIMSRENLLYRWWFDESLRSNTTEKDLRSRILTAYVNKHNFRKSLDIKNEKRVVAILVDPNGRVYWRSDGSYEDADLPALSMILTAHGD
ncbi:MAG: hypothetical protein V4587_19230 [Acidobacteriota bacterium]